MTPAERARLQTLQALLAIDPDPLEATHPTKGQAFVAGHRGEQVRQARSVLAELIGEPKPVGSNTVRAVEVKCQVCGHPITGGRCLCRRENQRKSLDQFIIRRQAVARAQGDYGLADTCEAALQGDQLLRFRFFREMVTGDHEPRMTCRQDARRVG